jgi:hypothetical protein
MPAIYSARCDACGHATRIFPDEWTGWRRDDGHVELLPHPGEFRQLLNAGVDIAQAKRERRILFFTNAVCERCATVQDVPAADAAIDAHGSRAGGIAVVALLVSGAVGGVWAALVAGVPWLIRIVLAPVWAICGALAMLLALGYVSMIPARVRAFLRIRARERPLPPAKRRCASCGRGGLHHPAYVAGRRLTCPSCGQRAFVFTSVGIS